MGAIRRGLLLGAGALALLPVSAFALGQSILVAKLAALAVLLLAALRPRHAWVSVAGLIPLGSALSGWLGLLSGSFAEPLVLAFLAGWLLREGTRSEEWPADIRPLVTVAALFGLTVAASVCVQLAVRQLSVDYWSSYLESVLTYLRHDYFQRPRLLPVAPGAQLLEGVGLFVATLVLTARNSALRVAGLAALICAAGMLGLLGVAQFIRTSAASGGVLAAIYVNMTAPTARISPGIADFNAAGSFFALALFLAGGLAWHKARRPLAVGAGLLTFAGLWLAGSRTAMIAIPLVVLGGGLLQARGRGSTSSRILLTSGLVLLVAAATYWGFSLTRPDRAATGAVEARLELSATALRIYADHPLFGVGVGRFYDVSEAYMAPRWRTMIMRENAHNNFLQFLAEIGLPGLGSFLWLLVAISLRVRPASQGWTPPFVGALMGLAAFLITCLAGHPFLTLEVALAFWLVLGTVGGATREGPGILPPGVTARLHQFVAPVLGALLLASVPVRAGREMAQAELSEAGIGVSNMRADSRGVRYRLMHRRARVYVPARTGQSVLPLKLSAGAANVTASVDGEPAGLLVVNGDEWREMRLSFRVRSDKFVAVDLRLGVIQQAPGGADAGATTRVLVGIAREVR